MLHAVCMAYLRQAFPPVNDGGDIKVKRLELRNNCALVLRRRGSAHRTLTIDIFHIIQCYGDRSCVRTFLVLGLFIAVTSINKLDPKVGLVRGGTCSLYIFCEGCSRFLGNVLLPNRIGVGESRRLHVLDRKAAREIKRFKGCRDELVDMKIPGKSIRRRRHPHQNFSGRGGAVLIYSAGYLRHQAALHAGACFNRLIPTFGIGKLIQ